QKLDEAKKEMQQQFKEIEIIKIRNEKTLEGALDSIITIGGTGKIEFFNKAAEEIWEYTKEETIGNDVSMLFSKETIENDEFIGSFVDPNKEKFIGERREANILTKSGEETPVLFLFSDAKVEGEYTVTAFIQNIEVELF
ncbi:MAG: histidine kinase, partial [Marinilabiliales bacterium]